MILTPPPGTDQALRDQAEDLFLSLGFQQIKWSNPVEHDRIISYTSQLAHVLSSAYIKSPAARTYRGFSAGSFRDMTRVAWLNEDMWTELFLENGDFLAEEVEGLAQRLMEYAKVIREGDDATLHRLLREGRLRKEELSGEDRE